MYSIYKNKKNSFSNAAFKKLILSWKARGGPVVVFNDVLHVETIQKSIYIPSRYLQVFYHNVAI